GLLSWPGSCDTGGVGTVHDSHDTTTGLDLPTFRDWHLTHPHLEGLTFNGVEHTFEHESGGGAGEARRRRTPPASPRRSRPMVPIRLPTRRLTCPLLLRTPHPLDRGTTAPATVIQKAMVSARPTRVSCSNKLGR